MNHRIPLMVWALACLVILPACEDLTAPSPSATPTPASATHNPAFLTSISVTPSVPSVALGNSQQFVATGTYSDGSTQVITSQVVWAFNNGTGTASISTAGLLTTTGGQQGTGTVSAAAVSISVSGNTTVTVGAPTLSSIAVAPASIAAPLGNSQQFTAIGTYSDSSTLNISGAVTWSKTNGTGSATISSVGLASTAGGSQGTVAVSASLDGITGSATLAVAPAALVSISVTPSNPSVAKGGTQQFSATEIYTDGSVQAITSTATWTRVNGTGSATLNANGLANTAGGSQGTVSISASLDGITGSTILTVAAPYAFSGGAGTLANPYQVSTTNDLQHVWNALAAYFTLTNDIDMSGVIMNPIGSVTNPFSGTFYGNNNRISYLTMSVVDSSTVALFGAVSGTVTQVKLLNVAMSSNGYAAGLVGSLTGMISACTVNGTITSGLGGNGYNTGIGTGLFLTLASPPTTAPYFPNIISAVYGSTYSGTFNGNSVAGSLNFGPNSFNTNSNCTSSDPGFGVYAMCPFAYDCLSLIEVGSNALTYGPQKSVMCTSPGF